MHILIASATPFEVTPLLQWLDAHYASKVTNSYSLGNHHLQICITGVGMPLTALNLGHLFALHRPDIAIQAGVAGAFHDKWPLANVVEVVSERLGDLGATQADGSFITAHEMGLIEPNAPPFRDGVLYNDQSYGFSFLPKAHGLSVNNVTGTESALRQLRHKFPDVDVENMEGAAFFLACLIHQVPFISIRSLSNRVEARQRANWKLAEAINSLNEVLIQMIQVLIDA